METSRWTSRIQEVTANICGWASMQFKHLSLHCKQGVISGIAEKSDVESTKLQLHLNILSHPFALFSLYFYSNSKYCIYIVVSCNFALKM